jgi:DNA-nicking Smr family endonuclease
VSKRQTTKDEHALFHAVATGQTPILPPKKPAAVRKPRKTGSAGLDGNTLQRLQHGEMAPEAKLDLHGMTEAAAHRTLAAFVHSAHRRGCRLVLIVTGKGAPRASDTFNLELDRRERGVLNAMVPRWLDEPPLAHAIAYKGPAHRRYGGAGALYVYLRKS